MKALRHKLSISSEFHQIMDVVNAPFEKYFQHVAFSAKMKYILRIFARLLIVACLYMGFGYTYVPDRTTIQAKA